MQLRTQTTDRARQSTHRSANTRAAADGLTARCSWADKITHRPALCAGLGRATQLGCIGCALIDALHECPAIPPHTGGAYDELTVTEQERLALPPHAQHSAHAVISRATWPGYQPARSAPPRLHWPAVCALHWATVCAALRGADAKELQGRLHCSCGQHFGHDALQLLDHCAAHISKRILDALGAIEQARKCIGQLTLHSGADAGGQLLSFASRIGQRGIHLADCGQNRRRIGRIFRQQPDQLRPQPAQVAAQLTLSGAQLLAGVCLIDAPRLQPGTHLHAH